MKINRDLLFIIILFFLALAIRLIFFQGFVLGDDTGEIVLLETLHSQAASLNHNFGYRFPNWLINVLFYKIFGISVGSFFAPTLIISSMIPVVGFHYLKSFNYDTRNSFAGGVILASSPFEIVLGTLRANDLITAFFLFLSIYLLFANTNKNRSFGLISGALFQLALWSNLWALYFVPGLIVLFLFYRDRLKYFLASTVVLFITVSIFFKYLAQTYFPYYDFAQTAYPIDPSHLPSLFLQYPKLLFIGSEFGTTLFGWAPYLLSLLLLVRFRKLVRLDLIIFSIYFLFFVFLNFMTNRLDTEQYFSVARIFKYLAPLSPFLHLHLSRLILDLKPTKTVLAILIFANLLAAAEATAPGRSFNRSTKLVVDTLSQTCPPAVIIEYWQSYVFRSMYLKKACPSTEVQHLSIFTSTDYEKWIKENEPQIKTDSVLVTGLNSYTHYGCRNCGFVLDKFSKGLSPLWYQTHEFTNKEYATPEPIRIWTFKGNQ